jgi:hypothetical protein
MKHFQNNLDITLIHGDGSSETVKIENSVSEDFKIGLKGAYHFESNPIAVLLPDGPRWDGWVWDSNDPWVPYPLLENHPLDSTARNLYLETISSSFSSGKQKFLYRWDGVGLDVDFSLKAIGLLNCGTLNGGTEQGLTGQGYIGLSKIDALALLPSPITIKGRLMGAQTPDILEVFYYISLVGV